MTMPVGTYYRVKTYSSGRRVRLAISPNGRILERTPIRNKVKQTRLGKRLMKRRRRIRI